MTDNDIIKALECCKVEFENCEKCPYGGIDCLTEKGESLIMRDALDLIKRLQERIKKLENIERFATKTIEKQSAEIENQQYILMGVMHSVDKWLDGDELKQDEVNRAATMREKTLQITEKKSAEIERLNVELVGMRGACESYRIHYDVAQAEIERLHKTQQQIRADLKWYLDTNEENGVVYIPEFTVRKITEVSE